MNTSPMRTHYNDLRTTSSVQSLKIVECQAGKKQVTLLYYFT